MKIDVSLSSADRNDVPQGYSPRSLLVYYIYYLLLNDSNSTAISYRNSKMSQLNFIWETRFSKQLEKFQFAFFVGIWLIYNYWNVQTV